jgi:hypothetical protein
MLPRWPVIGLAAVLAALAFTACSPDTAPTTPAGLLPRFAKGGNGGGGGSTSAIPVTSIVADAAADVAASLQLRSDGLGAYTNSSSLTSEIQSIGDWVLDALNPPGATRQVYLDFSQPIPGTGPNGGAPIAPPSGLYPFRAITKCSQDGNDYLTLAPGTAVSCPLHVAFTYNGASYAVEMNPNNAPETDNASVTCVTPATGSGPCTGWVIEPSGTFTGGLRNEAELIHYVTAKGKTQIVDEGDFYFSFQISVTNP